MTSRSDSYFIEATPDHIRAFADFRLPFEPKGEHRALRDDLRRALAGLHDPGSAILTARYTSAGDAFVDAENVLLYNVGGRDLGRLTRNGVRVERAFGDPRPVDGRRFAHLSEYGLATASDVGPVVARPVATLAFDLPRLSSDTKPHVFWLAARSGRFTRLASVILDAEPFALDLVVRSPGALSASSVVKPILDGVIASLQFMPDAREGGDAERRLAARLGLPVSEIVAGLRDSSRSVLGPGRLIHSHWKFIAWNPADDRCHRAQMLLAPAVGDDVTVEVHIGGLDASTGDS